MGHDTSNSVGSGSCSLVLAGALAWCLFQAGGKSRPTVTAEGSELQDVSGERPVRKVGLLRMGINLLLSGWSSVQR